MGTDDWVVGFCGSEGDSGGLSSPHWSNVLLLLMVQQVVRCADWQLRWLVIISMAIAVL